MGGQKSRTILELFLKLKIIKENRNKARNTYDKF